MNAPQIATDVARLCRAALNCGVPTHDIEGLVDYIVHGVPLGGFLALFVSNDLMGAIGKADHINQRALWEIASFLYNHAPPASYGSPEAYKDWTARRGLVGKPEQETA